MELGEGNVVSIDSFGMEPAWDTMLGLESGERSLRCFEPFWESEIHKRYRVHYIINIIYAFK